MTTPMVTKTLYLGNDYTIRRLVKLQATGEPETGATVRAFIAAQPGEMAAIDPSLEIASLTEQAAGDYVGTMQGDDLTTALLSGWAAAAALEQPYEVYERVVVGNQDYGDVVKLVVERDRPPTKP